MFLDHLGDMMAVYSMTIAYSEQGGLSSEIVRLKNQSILVYLDFPLEHASAGSVRAAFDYGFQGGVSRNKQIVV